jgi:hypothetical protein
MQSGIYQFLLTNNEVLRLQIVYPSETIVTVLARSGSIVSQTVKMIKGHTYPIIVDFWTGPGSGPSYSLAVSFIGSAWIPLILTNHYDHRKPFLEYAFNRMKAASYYKESAIIEDTNQIFQNMEIKECFIGHLKGKRAMLIQEQDQRQGSGLFNYATFNQGISLQSIHSITMMVLVSSVTTQSCSLCSFYNLQDTDTTAYPRRGWSPRLVRPQAERTLSFSIEATNKDCIAIHSNGWSAVSEHVFPHNEWFHLAFVRGAEGYTLFINGKPEKPVILPLDFQPVMEQIRIGCDNDYDGASWTGGLAWFRAYDYPLTTEQIMLDLDT